MPRALPNTFQASGAHFERTKRLHQGIDSGDPAASSRPKLTGDELARETELAQRSGQQTAARLDGALAAPCAEHAAAAGAHCWHDRRSGVSGICAARYAIGIMRSAVAR